MSPSTEVRVTIRVTSFKYARLPNEVPSDLVLPLTEICTIAVNPIWDREKNGWQRMVVYTECLVWFLEELLCDTYAT